MRLSPLRRLVAAATVLAVLGAAGAACSDDDDDGPADPGEAAVAVDHELVDLDPAGAGPAAALLAGDVDVAVLPATDPAIADHDLVALADDLHAQRADPVIAAVRTAAYTPGVANAVDAVAAALDADALRRLVFQVASGGQDVAAAATAFLAGVDVPPGADGPVTVGAGSDVELAIIGELYAQALERSGASVTRRFQLGERDEYLPTLIAGDLDVVPEVLGELVAHLDPSAGAPSGLDAAVSLGRSLAAAQGLMLLDPAPADRGAALVVTRATADRLALATVSDLRTVTEPLRFGGPPGCATDDTCLQRLATAYGLRIHPAPQ